MKGWKVNMDQKYTAPPVSFELNYSRMERLHDANDIVIPCEFESYSERMESTGYYAYTPRYACPI